jgi:hypothetical protein
MNLYDYIHFLGRIYFRENVDQHIESLDNLHTLLKDTLAGTYKMTQYVHRNALIIQLKSFKDHKQYIPIIEKVLQIKLVKTRNKQQEQLLQFSANQKQKRFYVTFPAPVIVEKITEFLDAHDQLILAVPKHPFYNFRIVKGKITLLKSDTLFQTSDFPVDSQEASELSTYFGNYSPDLIFALQGTTPNVIVNDFVLKEMKTTEPREIIQQQLNDILLKGVQYTQNEMKKYHEELDFKIKNLKVKQTV